MGKDDSKKVSHKSKSIKKDRKKKAKKDPNKPKRATTAFMFFSNRTRAEVKAEFPDKKVTEIAKVLGERWKSMSDDEKQQFFELAQQDKVRYEQEMKHYSPPSESSSSESESEEESPKKKKKKSSKKDEKKKKSKKQAPPSDSESGDSDSDEEDSD